MQYTSFLILVLYVTSLFFLGWRLMRMFAPEFPVLLQCISAFLVGIGVGVPVTYVFSLIFSFTSAPIFWGTFAITLLIAVVRLTVRRKESSGKSSRISLADTALIVFAIVFSTWIMTKTFHGYSNGQLFVGSNNVFDFGHALGIIRSFSWGSNIPIMSPYESGSPFFYHFYFPFFVAIWEYFGTPLNWAMNVPSIASFASLLVVVFYLPQIMAKQKPVAGWIAVALTITNSSLTFWHLLWQKGVSTELFRDIWRLPNYPFAGPFDGSTISLFVTLNNYVNQRHLAFSVAFGLVLYLLTVLSLEKKSLRVGTSLVVGIGTGCLFLWNMALYPLVFLLISLLVLLKKQWHFFALFSITAIGVALFTNLPGVGSLIPALSHFGGKVVSNGSSGASLFSAWVTVTYLWQNLGILPIIAGIGYLVLPKKIRTSFIPFIALFIAVCAVAGIESRGFDQKFYSFLIIGMNVLAAAGIWWVWQKRSWVAKIVATLLFFVVTVSGIVDVMPIKNEFAFPIVSNKILPVMSWIRTHTQKDEIFVSYADIIDPVVLAGRKNYFGFFGNIGWKYRTEEVRRIYGGDVAFAKDEGVDYLVVPKWTKSGFPYEVEINTLTAVASVVYEDTDFLVLKIE